MNHKNQPVVYLASASPRRRELLRQIGVAFRARPVDIDETPRPEESPARFVQRLALEKAVAAARSVDEEPPPVILGADTAVVVDERILGKPADDEDAVSMLGRLSGRSHHVLTGVAGLCGAGRCVMLSRTRVTFRDIDMAERRAYVASGEPADKAGAYAIQGRAAVFVERIDGSYTGVVGLPLYETHSILDQLARCVDTTRAPG
ncbi:MAG: septum formation inhibitor Maf [Gammaproteobacteria bacterium]|nr:septum formation inhibitor Maf [Gammaproteobacteria bacterium]